MNIVIGCDFHSRFQQLAIFDGATGEVMEKRLEHEGKEVEEFYRALPPATVAIEATAYTVWFQQLAERLGHELVYGDAARLRAMMTRKQKTDRRDAEHLLRVYLGGQYPRVRIPSSQQRDLRQLLLHRHRVVQMRTRLKNGLHQIAMNHRLCRKSRLFTTVGRRELEALPLAGWERHRRQRLLAWLDELGEELAALERAVAEQVAANPRCQRLLGHPGVGPVTALAWEQIMGDCQRFPTSRHAASYLGLTPREASSGDRQRLGSITKQGSRFLRFLLVEAAQTAVRGDERLGRHYRRLAARKRRPLAKVAVARRLAERLYWMSKRNVAYAQLKGGDAHASASSRGPLACSRRPSV